MRGHDDRGVATVQCYHDPGGRLDLGSDALVSDLHGISARQRQCYYASHRRTSQHRRQRRDVRAYPFHLAPPRFV